jgi:selenocysteine lyase/cysteine desulfurase
MTGTQSHEGMAGVTAAIEYLAELGRKVGASSGTGESDTVAVDASAGEGSSESHSHNARTSPTRRAQLLAAMHAIREYELELTERLINGLLKVPGLTFYGISDHERFAWRTPTVSVRMAGRTPRELAERLGERGIFCWDGNYYAVNLAERLGVEASGGMLRIGLVHYNTPEEVDALLVALRDIAAEV